MNKWTLYSWAGAYCHLPSDAQVEAWDSMKLKLSPLVVQVEMCGESKSWRKKEFSDGSPNPLSLHMHKHAHCSPEYLTKLISNSYSRLATMAQINLLAALGNDLRYYCFNCSLPAQKPREAIPCSFYCQEFTGSPQVNEPGCIRAKFAAGHRNWWDGSCPGDLGFCL